VTVSPAMLDVVCSFTSEMSALRVMFTDAVESSLPPSSAVACAVFGTVAGEVIEATR